MRTLFCIAAVLAGPAATAAQTARSMTEIIAASTASDWREIDPQNTLYLDLRQGRIVIELAPQFAPRHAENIRALAREHFFDGQSINRVQDNFVVQWGDAESRQPLKDAKRTIPAEFTRIALGAQFSALPDADAYAPQTGFADGFPAARDLVRNTVWPVHCYAMVGAGRDDSVDSGGGLELYAVIGHAPRQLDRNITIVGRVIQGMELLSALPRGPAPAGFYEKPEQRISIVQVRLASEVPAAERETFEAMRTDTAIFTALVESRRNRTEDWYKVQAGHIDVCNVPLPVRIRKK